LEIEQAIIQASSGSILEANVSASRGAKGAEFLVAQVVLRQGSPEIDLPKLAASLPLQQFMRPSVILVVDKFPVTDHGKRDRRALAGVDVSQLHRPKTKNVELSPEQEQVFAIWKDILPAETVGVHDITPDSDFFAIGGTSLTVLEVQKRIQKDLGARLEVATLFESSSLRRMASLIEERTQVLRSKEQQIDWDKEIQLDIREDQFRNAQSMRDWTASSSKENGLVVILTGATGFLGKGLLRALIATTEVAKVHCLAVRQVEKLSEFINEPTVQIHPGDLTSPRLGLSEEVARQVFSESHVIIHNGADVSFLKTYASLRQANVQSTRELIELSLSHVDGGHDFHFVSTAGVLGFSGEREFANHTASGFQPPGDGSFGYSASKWASERILERAADAYRLSVSIYRPTNITGDQAPELDLVHNIVKFSETLKVVPDPKGIWDGFINFVPLDTCTDEMLSSILHVAYGREPGIRYLHVIGAEDIPVEGLKSHLERHDGARTWYKQVGLAQWVAKAERAGLNPLTAAYLKKLAAEKQQLYLTRVLKERNAPDRTPDTEKSRPWKVFNGWGRA
jgi:hybrid polyketide synthase/nonribosomal peptide synthetase ACE1